MDLIIAREMCCTAIAQILNVTFENCATDLPLLHLQEGKD